MYKLEFPPDQTNYQGNWGSTVVQTPLDGGPPRTRLDIQGAVYTLTIQWTCVNTDQFDALQAFYRTAVQRGSQPFLIDLAIETAEPQEYTVVIQDQTWNLISTEGTSFVVGCILLVLQNPNFDSTGDVQMIAGIASNQ